MPFVKSVQRTAPSGPNDLSIRFYVADQASPDAGEAIADVNLGGETVSLVVRDVGALTGPQKIALRNALVAIRDAALAAAGFVDVP